MSSSAIRLGRLVRGLDASSARDLDECPMIASPCAGEATTGALT